MAQLFNIILFQPLLNLLVFLYDVIPGHDLGLAIILLTVIIKILLYPLAYQSIRAQKAMQELQPKVEAVKQQFKNDKERQAKEMMQMYKDNKVNPLSSCLPLLIQLPFLIAVYQVFNQGLKVIGPDQIYPFIFNPGQLNLVSFGILDLAKASVVLAVITGLAQFWQTKMLMSKQPPKEVRDTPGAKDEDMMAIMNKQMLYFMPLMTVFIGVSLPAGLVLYWLVMTLLTVAQQAVMFRPKKPAEVEVLK